MWWRAYSCVSGDVARQYARLQCQRDIAADGRYNDNEDDQGFCANVFHSGFNQVFNCKQYVGQPKSRMFARPHNEAFALEDPLYVRCGT